MKLKEYIETNNLIDDDWNHGKSITIREIGFHENYWIEYIQAQVDRYNEHMIRYHRDGINHKLELKLGLFEGEN